MSRDGYWKIHDDNGATMQVGVDLSAIVSADASSNQIQNDEFADPHGGGCGEVGNGPKPASFFVYWDQTDKKYSVFEPVVITPDGKITATLPESFDTGEEYSCCVTKDPNSGEYSAEIMLSEYAESEEDAVMSVPLFEIHDDGTVDQKHLGAIIINKGGVTSLKGDDEDSVKVDGDVEIDGGKCGLTVKTEMEEQDGDDPPKAKVTIDVKGREVAYGCGNMENWGCQEIKLPGGRFAHFLGCHPIDLSNVMTKSVGVDDPDEPEEEKDVIDGTTYVRTISGQTEESDTVSGDLDFRCPEGSGLVVKTVATRQPTTQNPNTDGTVTIDFDGRDALENCSKIFGIHQLKFNDKNGNPQIYHVISCGDIDLTESGKLIKSTKVTASADPGGINTIRFNYTDGTYDDFKIANGMDGSPGSPGEDGETPEITAEKQGDHTYIYANGDLIATISDGNTPQITAGRTGEKQTTIYADGNPIATINDGEDGQGGDDEAEVIDVVSGISFEFTSDGKTLNAKVTKKKIKAILVEDFDPVDVPVMSSESIDVVVQSTYNADGDYKFKNIRKKVKVLGTPIDATGQDVFTTTPLNGESN